MTTMSNKPFQGHGVSSSTIDADYLTLSVDSVRSLALDVSKGLQLNERQCQDLSTKLVQTVENIQRLVYDSPALRTAFGTALKNLYGVLSKAKLLVHQCCHPDWCRAAVFQIHNEGAFGELLREVGLCYTVTCAVIKIGNGQTIQAEDLRQSSLFLPAPESEVQEDQETLKRSLELVAGTSDDPNSYLASYLLRKLEYVSAARINEDLNVQDASLCMWMNETEPQGTWKFQHVLGKGSGALCVICYDWLGIPCARKEFHCQVSDAVFRREAAILAQLNHPNIVKLFCCSNGPQKNQRFIAMELMEMSLDSLIASRANARWSFPILLALDIMTQIARGVLYLHGLNIAHRDLKPQNVVVTETRAAHLEDCFCVKLVDFGMSKTKVQVSKSNSISNPGAGTTIYRAPEVFPQPQLVAPGPRKKVNWFRVDAYSFGITCAMLLSLKEPFKDVPRSALYEDLLRGVRPELPGQCPEALVSLLKDCWATDPQCRPGFSEICSRLEQCKLQELLRVSCEGLQEVAGCEYIETVLIKQPDEQSQSVTGVPCIQSLCSSLVSNSDDAEEASWTSQFDEEASRPSDAYSEDSQSIALSKSETKKKIGLWRPSMSSLVRVKLMSALLWKKTKEKRSLWLNFQQKCEKFDVKPTLFPYNELRVATQNFHENMKLGRTAYGVMYKGVLRNGSVVTVKMSLPLCSTVDKLFDEVFLFTGVRHRNLVTVKGCCLHDQQCLVVYEYVENLDVRQILLDKGPSRQMLSWPVRLKICLGVAQGLHYLHALAHPKIIHGCITASCVLLDRNFVPKLGDFSLALSFTDDQTHVSHARVVGACGYFAPEYVKHGILSDKVDVHNFGVLCLEIISGRRGMDVGAPVEQMHLREWAWRLHEEEKLSELVDPTLQLTNAEVREVQRVIKLCLACVQTEAKSRPSMASVVSILQGDTEWDEQVKRQGGSETAFRHLHRA